MKPDDTIKYPVGVQSFSKLREDGYLYVDKTETIYSLIRSGGYFFLARPRRFGKSLLLSTLEAYYSGRRELFEGLALDRLTDDWEPHPVLHLDLNFGRYETPEDLDKLLSDYLDQWESLYCDAVSATDAPSIRFNNVIRRAREKTGKRVVILIDEYDKPLLNAIDNPALADYFRSQLKAFYANLKSMDDAIELALLTGVARFSKVSIFSDLNNLRDISFSKEFASICGVTPDELDRYFHIGIENLASELGKTREETREELRRRYDGYHFSIKSPDIYNPFSLMNVFADNSLRNYWFDSGTPTYLVRLVEKGHYPFRDIAPSTIDRAYLETAGLLDRNPDPVFYQSGYLTIKGYDPEFDTYLLDYPNEEVKEGFLKFLMRSCVPDSINRKGFSIPDFAKDVNSGDPESFMKRVSSLVASIPYGEHGHSEDHFQNAVFLLFSLLGYYARVEDRTSNGRIDLQVETSRYIYIFEFKIDSTSETAMAQIRDKQYWLRELSADKEIFLIGASFDSQTRRLTPPIIERP